MTYTDKLNTLQIDTEEIRHADEILDGVILSDGHLCRVSNIHAAFDISLSGDQHIDWIYRIKDSLSYLGIPMINHDPKISNAVSHGMPYTKLRLISPRSEILFIAHNRWYMNKIKFVPEDFILTPISLANWFMGDGSSTYNNQNAMHGVRINLSTEKFSSHDLDLLEAQLAKFEIYDIARVLCECGGYRLMIKTDFSSKFMDVVEPHMVTSFKYKIKRTQWQP